MNVQQRPQQLSLASSNLATFEEQPGGSPSARHSRHASLAGVASANSEAGSTFSGFQPAAERDGLAAPSVDWQLGALAEEVIIAS